MAKARIHWFENIYWNMSTWHPWKLAVTPWRWSSKMLWTCVHHIGDFLKLGIPKTIGYYFSCHCSYLLLSLPLLFIYAWLTLIIYNLLEQYLNMTQTAARPPENFAAPSGSWWTSGCSSARDIPVAHRLRGTPPWPSAILIVDTRPKIAGIECGFLWWSMWVFDMLSLPGWWRRHWLIVLREG